MWEWKRWWRKYIKKEKIMNRIYESEKDDEENERKEYKKREKKKSSGEENE